MYGDVVVTVYDHIAIGELLQQPLIRLAWRSLVLAIVEAVDGERWIWLAEAGAGALDCGDGGFQSESRLKPSEGQFLTPPLHG